MKKLFTIFALLLCQLATIAQTDETAYALTILSEPDGAATFSVKDKNNNWGSGFKPTDNTYQVPAGKELQITVTLRSGFAINQMVCGDSILERVYGYSYDYELTMPAHDVTLTLTAHYAPGLPSHPDDISWNEETGALLILNFTPGNLSGAITDATMDEQGKSHKEKVRSLTVSGKATDSDLYNLGGVYTKTYQLRLLDFSRTSGVITVADLSFMNETVLTTVLLPASIEKIGRQAFQNCPQLESVTCYATTPPVMEKDYDHYPFDGCSEALTVYVPAESLPFYAEADGWKNLQLMPITQGAHALTVSLPANADMRQLKDMKLEMVNAKTGQTRHYILTNRTQYTFTNLIQGTQYNIYIRNAREYILASILGVEIDKQDVQVTFPAMKPLRDVTIQLLDPEGNQLPSPEGSGVGVTWTDAVGNFLATGATLTAQVEGTKAIAKIKLGETLGTQYQQPADTLIVVGQGYLLPSTAGQGVTLTIPLQPLPQVELSGKVTAEATSLPIRGATVSVTQQLNGLYPVTRTATTDVQGQWTLTAYDAPTTVTAQATGYIPQTRPLTVLAGFGGESPDFALHDLTGTTVSVDLQYFPAVAAGLPTAPADQLPDLGVVSYDIFDVTHQQQLTNAVIQADRLVLQNQQLPEGTLLRVTAKSADGLFIDAVGEATVDANNTATVSLPLVQPGQLKATFAQTSNQAVVGILYNTDGQLYAKGYYSTPSEGYPQLTFTAIPNGSYTLVTMGESQMFNGINTLAALTEMNLVEGRDYVSNAVTIDAGRIDSLHNQTVPMMDESLFQWTTESTIFQANKTTLTVGNYVTLRTLIDFKSGFSTKDVKLLYNLPEGCQLVEGSVMVGNQLAQYNVDGQRVTVPLLLPSGGQAGLVRFCVVPANEGNHEVTASVSFTTEWHELTQSLGTVNFTAEALRIDIPEQSPNGKVPVSGAAIAQSMVKVYDGDVLIGQTMAGPDGNWNMQCLLWQPYNLSRHTVYAVVTTPDGLTTQTTSQTVTMSHGTLVPVVTGLFFNEEQSVSSEIKWDFRTNSVSPNTYSWPHEDDALFTFTVDFMDGDEVVNDITAISNVTLYVLCSDNTYLTLDAAYNTNRKRWYAQHSFSPTASPKNVFVDFLQNEAVLFDRQELDDMREELELSLEEWRLMVKDVYTDEEVVLEDQALFDELEQLLAIENPDEATRKRANELIDLLTADAADDTTAESASIGDIDAYLASLDEVNTQWRDNMLQMLSYVASTDTAAYSFDNEAENQSSIPMGNGTVTYTSKKLGSIDEQALLAEGYRKTDLTDGTAVFMLRNDDKESYIDGRNRMQYTFEWQEGAAARFGSQKRVVTVSNIFDPAEKARFDALVDELSRAEALASINDPTMTLEGRAKQLYLGTVKKLCDQLIVATNNLYINGLDSIRQQTEAIYRETVKLCNDTLKALEKHIPAVEKEVRNFKKDNDIFAGNGASQMATLNTKLDKLKISRENFKSRKNKAEKYKKWIDSDLCCLPRSLDNAKKKAWVYNDALRFKDSPMGLIYWLYWTYFETSDVRDDLEAWQKTLSSSEDKKKECEGTDGEDEAEAIYSNALSAIASNGHQEKEDVWLDAVKVSHSDLYGHIPSNKEEVPLSWYYTSWGETYPQSEEIIKSFKEAFGCFPYIFYASEQSQLSTSEKARKKLNSQISALKCKKKPDPEPEKKNPIKDKNTTDPGSANTGSWLSSMIVNSNPFIKLIDPSGYVYEAVSSNRLEGVTATCYYLDKGVDKWGDMYEEAVVWDAENYAQENPLFTDADGRYRWDVPQGLWQVKYEKAGYETAYSDWLPVPPPQLEVNVGMTQLRQPAVKKVKAYTDGIDITFDKYMRPQTLTNDNIFVTVDGQTVSGTIELLNADSGYETPDSIYASSIRFVTDLPSPGEGSGVGLTVRRTVESYAGLQMEQDFQQEFDVEQRIETIVADSILYMSEGSEHTVTVRILPAEAAKGKTLTATSLSEDIVTIGAIGAIEDGTAQLQVKASSLGSAAVRFALADDDEPTATTTIHVRDSANMFVYMPTASRMSGTEVYRGAEIRLTTQTAGATIVYTLDGSCPCDAWVTGAHGLTTDGGESGAHGQTNGGVLIYRGPIVATGTELHIKAMAVANGLAESNVAEFSYKVIDNVVGIEADRSTSSALHSSPSVYFRLDGRRTATPQKGLNIVRQEDGTVKKILVK